MPPLTNLFISRNQMLKCCGEYMEIFGVDDKGMYKYYCNLCHKIEFHKEKSLAGVVQGKNICLPSKMPRVQISSSAQEETKNLC